MIASLAELIEGTAPPVYQLRIDRHQRLPR